MSVPVKHIRWRAPYTKRPDGMVKAGVHYDKRMLDVISQFAPDAAAKRLKDQKRTETRQLMDRIRASLKA